jgi:hypothetical protein
MKKCLVQKVVSRKDGGTQRVCAKFESTNEDVLARSTDEDESEDVGSLKIDVIRGFKGFDLSAKSILPCLLAGIAVEGSTLLLRKYVANATVNKFAPAISILAGVAVSIPLRAWGGQKAMEDGIKTAVVVGGLHQLVDYLSPRLGLGLLVPQSVLRGLVAERVGGLVAERVGSLPSVPVGDSAMPAPVRSMFDVSAYGKV